MSVKATCIEQIPIANTLGEGVLWRESDASVWWTDIIACKLYQMAWSSLVIEVFETPEEACSFSFVEGDDDTLLVAFRSGFAFFKPSSGAIHWLDRHFEVDPQIRMNDGRTDPAGRFWAGSMVERDLKPGEAPPAMIYRLGEDGKARRVIPGLHLSNGICWSPSGDRMYYADSMTGTVMAASYDLAAGRPGPFKPFVSFTWPGGPDGAMTDASGVYWSAQWGGGRIAGTSPDGSHFGDIAIDTPAPTCLAFGGEGQNILLVTTATEGVSDDEGNVPPGAGDLYIYETNLRGWPQSRFKPRIEPRWRP